MAILLPALVWTPARAADSAASRAEATANVGVVSHIQVSTSDQDISSLEAWRKSAIKDGMTDAQKALAIFETVVRYQHEMDPPLELLHREKALTDALKTFNVYGYNQCGPGASHLIELARFAGLRARGAGVNGHTVAEVFYDGAWHMYDASYINYFPKPDGSVASVEELIAAVKEWHAKNPQYDTTDKVREFHNADRSAWKTKGPALLAACPLLDEKGNLPARLMDWAHLMRIYDGSKNFEYETGYSMGYEVNVQLRPGERIVRNWSHQGLHINMAIEGAAPWLKLKPGEGQMAYTPRYGDLAPGRVGNGTIEYDVPLGDPSLRSSALRYENLAVGAGGDGSPALRVKDATKPGILEIRMPTSYVFLSGFMTFQAVVPEGGAVTLGLSTNNGLDWMDSELDESISNKVNMLPFVIRRYEYRLRFILKGEGTGLDLLKLTHDIQHSQRPLPALVKGENTVRFSAGPQEGTVTLEGATDSKVKAVQLVYSSFHPKVSGIKEDSGLAPEKDSGEITFPVETPGDMKRLRIFAHYRARDAKDVWDVQVSFDGGKTWREAGKCEGPAVFDSRYFIVSDIPAGTKSAMVRFAGSQVNALRIFNFRIDADYAQPYGGFRPVKVKYVWEENGVEKTDTHTTVRPDETYKIICQDKPLMKSLILELADDAKVSKPRPATQNAENRGQ